MKDINLNKLASLEEQRELLIPYLDQQLTKDRPKMKVALQMALETLLEGLGAEGYDFS